jgi:hypothetical protein
MYRVAPEIDLKEFVGSSLAQICLGKFDVVFRFSGGSDIAAQCPVKVLKQDEVISSFEEDGFWTTMRFGEILNLDVESYSVPNDRCLRIAFDCNYFLEFHDDSDQYESFQIYPKGDVGQIIVV